MNSINLGNQIDEVDLEAELDELRQEELDQKMLETGSVPVDAIQRLPAVANGERKLHAWLNLQPLHRLPANGMCSSQRKANSGGRRGSRASKAAGRNGYLRGRTWRGPEHGSVWTLG